jgi:hypothetical protein
LTDPEISVRKASTRSPILSLVDREYLKSTANIPRSAWESISYLYSECDESIHRITAMTVPPELDWVRQGAIKSRRQCLAWLDELLLQSQSIEALRSWQMMTGLQNQTQPGRPSGAVMPDFNQPTPPGQEKPRRGLIRRGSDS